MAFHTVREFEWAGLVHLSSGFLPVVGIQLALLAWWWGSRSGRPLAADWLVATGWFQLVGGAVISVLPLPFLPFAPEQTVGHYVSHLVFGLAQMPLLLIPRRT